MRAFSAHVKQFERRFILQDFKHSIPPRTPPYFSEVCRQCQQRRKRIGGGQTALPEKIRRKIHAFTIVRGGANFNRNRSTTRFRWTNRVIACYIFYHRQFF